MFHIVLHLFVREFATNQPLEGKDRVDGIYNGLTFGRQTDKTLAVLRKGNDRRCCPSTFRILDDSRGLAFHDGHAGVSCAQINTNDGSCE